MTEPNQSDDEWLSKVIMALLSDHIDTYSLDKESSQMLNEDIADAKAAIKSRIQERERAARIDELNHLGFDRRLDNPTLYCDGNNAMSINDRIQQLNQQKEHGE